MAFKKQKTHYIKKYNDVPNILEEINDELINGISCLFILWNKEWKCPAFSEYYIIFQTYLKFIEPEYRTDFLETIKKINYKIRTGQLAVYDLDFINKECVRLYDILDI